METFEFVTEKHPDKICDICSDTIVSAFISQDKDSRCAVECMGGHGKFIVTGEVTSKGGVDIKKLLRPLVPGLKIEVNIVKQSPEIARGVDNGGAGDQGICVGYATRETKSFMPLGYELARDLCKRIYEKYPHDGKTQITLDGDKVLLAVASFQNTAKSALSKLVREIIKADDYQINPAGDWNIGGFDADTGLTGRKIAIDNYGTRVPIGGGSFSGKDMTKVDRSGAYAARVLAIQALRNNLELPEALVKVGFVIGFPKSVMVTINDNSIDADYFNVSEMVGAVKKAIKGLSLAETAKWGHFGNGFPWG
jgi:S-adenosylmethionine synthetase